MATAVITKTTLISAPHQNVFDYINNRSYVTDPRNTNSTEQLRVFVYDRDPFQKAINFNGLPYIIVGFPTMGQSKWSQDGKVKEIEWTQEITCRAARDGSANNQISQGRTDMLSMADDLHSLFNNNDRKKEFQDLNMFFMTLNQISDNSVTIQMKELMEWSFELTYHTRITVSD